MNFFNDENFLLHNNKTVSIIMLDQSSLLWLCDGCGPVMGVALWWVWPCDVVTLPEEVGHAHVSTFSILIISHC